MAEQAQHEEQGVTPSNSLGDQTPVNDVPNVADKNEKDLERRQSDTPKTAADWLGPDDPGNAQNWPLAKKVYHSGVTAALSFAVTYGSSCYSPGIPQVVEEFNVSKEVATLGTSLYVLGLALGPMISAGLSETYGRKVVYIYLTPVSLLFTMGAGLSRGIASELATRFLAGATGAGPLAVGAGTNADIWAPVDRAAATGIWVLMPFLGTALGLPTASYPIQDVSWRWSQWLLLIIGGAAYVLSLMQEETYKKAILLKRAKKYGLTPPHDPLPAGFARIKAVLNITCVRSLRMLFTEPICTCFSVYSAFNFGVLFAYFTAVTWVYRTVYHFSVGEAGLIFISIALGCLIATAIFIFIDRHTYRKQALARIAAGNHKQLPPELRLYPAMVGAFLLPIGLFWFGWTARPSIHW